MTESEPRAILKSRLELSLKVIENSPLPEDAKQKIRGPLENGLQKLEALPETSIDEKREIENHLNVMLDALEQFMDRTGRRKTSKITNKEQLKAQLVSTKEQAETSMQSVVPIINGLLERAEGFDEMSEEHRSLHVSAARAWMDLVQGGDPHLEERVTTFRALVEGDGTRSPKEIAFLSYIAMHFIDFASVLLCLGELDESHVSSEASEIMIRSIQLAKVKRASAHCILMSLGINSPQEAVMQMEWLKEMSLKKSKEAKIEWGVAEVGDNGDVHLKSGDICWRKKDED